MKEYQIYVMCGITRSDVPIFAWRVRQKGLPKEYRALEDECGGLALKYPAGRCKVEVQLEEAVQKMLARIKPQIKPGDQVEYIIGPAPGSEWEAEEGEVKKGIKWSQIKYMPGPLCFKEYASEEEQKKIAKLIEKYK